MGIWVVMLEKSSRKASEGGVLLHNLSGILNATALWFWGDFFSSKSVVFLALSSYQRGVFSHCAFEISMLNPLRCENTCICRLVLVEFNCYKTLPWKPHLGWCWHVPHILPVFRSCQVVLCGKCYRDKS